MTETRTDNLGARLAERARAVSCLVSSSTHHDAESLYGIQHRVSASAARGPSLEVGIAMMLASLACRALFLRLNFFRFSSRCMLAVSCWKGEAVLRQHTICLQSPENLV